MIIGLGTDIVNIERIAKLWEQYEKKFLSKYLTEDEQNAVMNVPEKFRINKVAKLFAAKEAAAKALGTGFRDGLEWKDVEVSHDENGAPLMILHQKALERALVLSNQESFQTLISLSDDAPYAQAVVIIEKCGCHI